MIALLNCLVPDESVPLKYLPPQLKPFIRYAVRLKNFAATLLFSCLGATGVLAGCSPPAPQGDGDGDGVGDGDGDTGISPTDGKLPDGSDASAAIPARIRRLTNAEYNASIQALLQTDLTPAVTFPPDSRQHGYTLNEAQRIDPVLARQLDAAAMQLATLAVEKLDALAPCADQAAGGEACARSFIDSFASQAYRRPLTDDDITALMTLYQLGAEGTTYADGIHQVVRGVLQSPGFLYLTEIGSTPNSGVIRMTSHELAASLSYLLTGGPPDAELAALAASGELDSADVRAAQTLRLVNTEAGQRTSVKLVREWLGIDRIISTAKDSNVYPNYEGLRDAMGQETSDFVSATLSSSRGSLDELLGAPWTVANAQLAQVYGASGEGRIDTPDRPGLLNQSAFLSVYAHAHETGPVLRGVAVMRRVTCQDIELPLNLDVEIIPPVPDPALTTRERFAIHASDDGCANCHKMIDPIGFSFEQFDAMGAFRTEENARPVDSTGTVALGKDFDGPYDSSSQLAVALSTSADVAECFARQMFRAGSGEGTGAKASEEAFLESWNKLDQTDQRSLLGVVVALANSDLMSYRIKP